MVTVVLAPSVVGAVLQGQLVTRAVDPVQEHRPAALTEVGPAPRLGHPPGGGGVTWFNAGGGAADELRRTHNPHFY